MKLKKGMKVEDLYPNKRCRDAADKAMDLISVNEPMSTFLDAWDANYVSRTVLIGWLDSVCGWSFSKSFTTC